MSEIKRLRQIQANIARYEKKYKRRPRSVKLIAVSKTRTGEEISNLCDAGQVEFGENYLQEALNKVESLSSRNINWHFIGAIQSKKAPKIAQSFDWVHSIDRLKVAQKLNDARLNQEPLNALIQVNLEAETSKGGVAPNELLELANQVAMLPNLSLRGLMFMPMSHDTYNAQLAVYKQAKEVFNTLKSSLPSIDQLSMGMSADMEAAIAEGATMVRIGTALFGPRLK